MTLDFSILPSGNGSTRPWNVDVQYIIKVVQRGFRRTLYLDPHVQKDSDLDIPGTSPCPLGGYDWNLPSN